MSAVRQRAMDLGLSLMDDTLQLLAKMPLRSSVKLLEAGKEARGNDLERLFEAIFSDFKTF